MRIRAWVVGILALSMSATAFAGEAKKEKKNTTVYVNDVALETKLVRQLELAYQTKIQPGYYWYDQISGLWGYKNGPAAGQVMPGLQLGGKLKANASAGDTGIFINGRELHGLERAYLVRTYGAQNVKKGRYWMNSYGIGGYEGGPAFFNLGAQRQTQKRSLTGGYSVTGGVLGGGGMVGYTDSSGRGITCGPDGGCF